MKKRMLALLLSLSVLTACAEEARKEAPVSDRRAIQAMATSACECALTGKPGECWASYQKLTAPFRPPNVTGVGGFASACSPVSTQEDCFRDANGIFCVTTGYYVNGIDLEPPTLCRQSEARALEQAYNKGFEGPGGSQARAEREAKAALASAREGKASLAPSSQAGCV